MNERPMVGIAVFVCKENRFIMGLRRGSHGLGTWSLPGGHLEYGESFDRAAAREVMEETSLEIGNVKIAAITNDLFEETGRHYVTMWAVADYLAGTPAVQEPDKYVDLQWVAAEDMPDPLFKPWQQLTRAISIEDVLRRPEVATADLVESHG